MKRGRGMQNYETQKLYAHIWVHIRVLRNESCVRSQF